MSKAKDLILTINSITESSPRDGSFTLPNQFNEGSGNPTLVEHVIDYFDGSKSVKVNKSTGEFVLDDDMFVGTIEDLENYLKDFSFFGSAGTSQSITLKDKSGYFQVKFKHKVGSKNISVDRGNLLQ